MGWKATVGTLLGGILLAVAVLTALYGTAMVATSLAWELPPPRFAAMWFAVTTGFAGYFVRKHVAGQALPADYSGSEAKAHDFSCGMKPTTGNQTTGDDRADIPPF